ncbi:putative F-box protein At3g52320 [Corylus avellana]|uniref:putative F-box protein At3g52320 n=1 Tax=Corylus avellana TaxID=13451 RepID=UPI00286C5C67|nr:putative F-box protein At3g52320 [Corylus avellana]
MSLLLGLRRVSQSFNTSICRRSFAHCHFTTQSPTGRILFLANLSQREQYFYSAEIKEGGTLPPISVQIFEEDRFQFCNGLLYTHGIGQNCMIGDGGKNYIISPDTGEVSPLPYELRQWRIGDGFDQYFGFDPSSNKHKVLIVHYDMWLFRIFTLGSGGSWRTIHTFLSKEKINHPWPRNVVYANGTIHWFYFGSEYVVDHPDVEIYYRIRGRGRNDLHQKCIVCFDMADEQFTRIHFPDDDSFPQYLTEFGGRLALLEEFVLRNRKMLGYNVLDVEYDKLQYWVLEVYKWVKETIHLPFGWMRHNNVVAFNNNTGEMLLTSANRRRNPVNVKSLLYYNTKTGFFRRPQLTGEITEFLEIPQKDGDKCNEMDVLRTWKEEIQYAYSGKSRFLEEIEP